MAPAEFAERSVLGLPLWLAAAGVLTAWYFVLRRPDQAAMMRERAGGCTGSW